MSSTLKYTAVIHEKENGGPSNTPNEQPGSRAPGLSPIKKGSEDRDRRERNDQGAVAERPTEIPPARQTEIPPEQPTEIPKGECQRPSNTLPVLTSSSREEKYGGRGYCECRQS